MLELKISDLNDCTVLIGDENRESYFPAIIAVSRDRKRVAYNYDKLAECFMQLNDWTIDEAVEWIDYNVERRIPYENAEYRPALVMSKRISNRTWQPARIISE